MVLYSLWVVGQWHATQNLISTACPSLSPSQFLFHHPHPSFVARSYPSRRLARKASLARSIFLWLQVAASSSGSAWGWIACGCSRMQEENVHQEENRWASRAIAWNVLVHALRVHRCCGVVELVASGARIAIRIAGVMIGVVSLGVSAHKLNSGYISRRRAARTSFLPQLHRAGIPVWLRIRDTRPPFREGN